MDINNLINALDNNNNETLLQLTSQKILQMNFDILSELNLDDVTLRNYLSKLKNYRYIDELTDLKYGSFIKWIPIIDPNYLPLHYSGIICDIKITDNGVIITCKNFMHRHYTFKMDETLIFQKLTSQEQLIVKALDYLDKNSESDETEGEDEDCR
jgi:hypothetical protein